MYINSEDHGVRGGKSAILRLIFIKCPLRPVYGLTEQRIDIEFIEPDPSVTFYLPLLIGT